MTATTATPAPVPAASTGGARRLPRSRALRLALLILAAAALVSLVRVVTGADDLTSSGQLSAAIGLAVPIGLAGLAGLWSERAGVVNIGLEGMMIVGTLGAGWAGYQHGPWAGVVAGVAFGAVGGLVHAVATVTFGVDHIVSGVAINILGLGASQYLAASMFTGVPGGGATQSPPVGDLPTVTVPGVGGPLLDLERHHWFLISDLAGGLRALTTGLSVLTVIAALLVAGTLLVLWRTPFGLRLRSVGEDPWAAESLGVPVARYKYVAVIVSGALSGLAGVFLAIVASSAYREGQTGGRGFIGLAAMIFGNWRPGGLAAGAALFGYTDALQLRGQSASVHALLLVAGVGVLALAVRSWRRRRVLAAAGALATGAACLVWYLLSDEVPGEFTVMTPYVATLLVLALASQRLRPPAADGVRYRRGEGR